MSTTRCCMRPAAKCVCWCQRPASLQRGQRCKLSRTDGSCNKRCFTVWIAATKKALAAQLGCRCCPPWAAFKHPAQLPDRPQIVEHRPQVLALSRMAHRRRATLADLPIKVMQLVAGRMTTKEWGKACGACRKFHAVNLDDLQMSSISGTDILVTAHVRGLHCAT